PACEPHRAAAEAQVSGLTRRPSGVRLRPSTLALRPSTFDLRPSTFDLRPSTFDLRMPPHPLVVVPHDLRSAYNVGSVFRTADAAGLRHVYLTGFTPTPEHRGVRKTALGAEEAVPWSHHADP